MRIACSKDWIIFQPDCEPLAESWYSISTPFHQLIKQNLLAGNLVFLEELFARRCDRAIGRSDAARLAVVLSDLLTNALKYTPHGGTVEVAVAAKSPEPGPDILQIAVTDTGPGIPRESRERIFEKFFRLEHLSPNTPEGVQGVGIGLYLCRQIVAMHCGTIGCEPGVGEFGTRFVIKVPSPNSVE